MTAKILKYLAFLSAEVEEGGRAEGGRKKGRERARAGGFKCDYGTRDYD